MNKGNTLMAKILHVESLDFNTEDVSLVHRYRLQCVENMRKVNLLLGKAPTHEALNARYRTLKDQLEQLDFAYVNCPSTEIVYKNHL